MPFAILLLGVILIVAAYNGTHGKLGQALQQDAGGFFKWMLATIVVLGLGFIPGLERPTRWLLALMGVVFVLTNYQKIIDGLSSFSTQGASQTGAGTPAPLPYTDYPGSTPSPAQVAGDQGGSGTSSVPASIASTPGATLPLSSILANPLNPSSYVGAIQGMAGGFGS